PRNSADTTIGARRSFNRATTSSWAIIATTAWTAATGARSPRNTSSARSRSAGGRCTTPVFSDGAVPDSCTVLIAAADLLPPLKERDAREGGELLAFTDGDALRALETIMKRRPAIIALERAFATTPRGAALIN